MKKFVKILSLILALLMVSSVIFACNNDDGNTDDSSSQDKTPKYDGIFKVGYSRYDISPTTEILLKDGRLMTGVADPIYTTCIAVHDGDTTVLLYTIDVSNIKADQYELIRKRISTAVNVPLENIVICPTHNHSAPQPGIPGGNPNNVSWTFNVVHTGMIESAKEAIADLDDAEILTAVGKTTGMAFVRRYFLADGSFKSIQDSNQSTAAKVAYESEADDNVQVIRFVRENKKDIVMANWQAHVAHAITVHKTSVSGDFVGVARKIAESLDEDILFAMYIGASGNINLDAKVAGTQKYTDYNQVGRALGRVIVDTFETMEKVEAGKISVSSTDFIANVRKDTAKRVAEAKRVYSKKDADNYDELLLEYGFETKYDVEYTIFRNESLNATDDLPLSAISFGDLGFVTVPFEMFDTNGMEIKDGSPFKTTFVLTNAGDSMAYVPSALAVKNGGYEVYTTHYEFGTGEKVASALVDLLKSQVK